MRKTVLAIGAHPDDIEIGCGGTLALLKRQGHVINHLVITAGEEGKRSVSRSELAQVRKTEAERSAQILGASCTIFFDAADGLTSFSKDMKIRLISLIREMRPDTIFTHARSDHFPDHQVVHQLTTSAALAASGPWYPEIQQPPHTVMQIYGYEVWNPISEYQLAVDIRAVMNLKLEALRAHKSQIADVDYVGAVNGLAKYRGVTSMAGEYAEVFEILKGTL
ncbi:MAG: PIG-L deacetylase family protein [Pseudobdellovibrionaceae bacterium]